MIDYEGICQSLGKDKVRALIEKLGIDYIDEKENCFIMSTICHNEDGGSHKLYYYFDTHMFYCYTECGAMTIFKFLRNVLECRGGVYDWYQDIYKPILQCSSFIEQDFQSQGRYKSIKSRYNFGEKDRKLVIYDKSVLECFTKHYPVEWLNDGISKDTMDKFNILFSISQNKIIIPHYDVSGSLVGIRGRALSEWECTLFGKYAPVRIEKTMYSHPLSYNLYGLNWDKEAIARTGIVYVFEGEKSVMQVESFNMPNCSVAVCGSHFNKFQLQLLLQECHVKEVVLCFDKEELEGSTDYFDKLAALCHKYNEYCDFSFIYDRENLLRQKDSPSDRGEATFKNLLSKRIRIK